jgi:predicted dehydrogenase
MAKNVSRRDFVKRASLTTAGIAVGSSIWTAKSYGRILGANDRLNFAIAGLHGRGYAHMDAIIQSQNAVVSHICDVDSRELEKFGTAVQKATDQMPVKEKDYRKIMEIKDIDVVTIATPEHWHAPMAIMALQAGKHVYVEKPCSHNPHEGQLLVAAQKKYKKLVQMGNQQRSSNHTIEIMKRIHNGLIGTPYFGKAWYNNTRGPIGVGKEVPVPDYLDWELWQGPVPRRPYKDNVHPYNWHWFWNWGTGETLNNGTHEVDLCRWALQVGQPKQINASGGRYHYKDDWEFYDTLVTNFQYDDKTISWEGVSCNGKTYFNRGRGALILGTKGSVMIDRSGYLVFDINDRRLEEYYISEGGATSDLISRDEMTVQHFQNLMDGIRKNESLHSPIEEGNISVTMLQLSNVAWKTGTVLNLDEKTGKIIDNPEAMKYWQREYEKGWEPKI